jgi:hypothetical protein
VPVVSEDPRPYYPAIDYSSEEESWSDTSTTTPYQERNIYKTHCPEGTYREVAGDRIFIFTYLPGLRNPIRAYKPHRNHSKVYSTNPNYQASLYKPYHHRVLTESEQRAFEEEAPKIIQTYINPKEENLAPVSGSLYSLYSSTTEISKIKFGKTLDLRLEDSRPVPFKSIKVKGGWKSNLPYTLSSTPISGTRSGSLLEEKTLERSSLLTCGILRLWRQMWTQARTLILGLNLSGTGTKSKRKRRSRVPPLRGRGRGATP